MPREWPPVSVWLLLALAAGPVIGFAAIGAAVLCFGVIAAMFYLPVSPFVIAGRPFAYVAFALVALAQGLMSTLVIALVAVLPSGPPAAECVVWWAGTVGVCGLLMWQETRRWCGLLPVEDDDP